MNKTKKTQKERILIFTGDGKGKTTAAIGMVVRSAGHGMAVLVLQFIKSNQSTGESIALRQFRNVEFRQTGRGFVPSRSHPEFEMHRLAAQEGLKEAEEALKSGRYDFVCLDEVISAVSLGLVTERAVLEVVKEALPGTILVMTGRGATTGLIEIADTVTEMRVAKHGYNSGYKAQKGVEY